MKKTIFVACGFAIDGTAISFGAPSPGLIGLTTQLRPGDGLHTVTALKGPTGHATDGSSFDVYFNSKTRELDWRMRGGDWEQRVIVQEPLVTALLAELRNL